MSQFLLLSLTIDQLSDCPDALAYGDSVKVFLWQGLFPLILTVSVSRIVLKVLYSVFD